MVRCWHQWPGEAFPLPAHRAPVGLVPWLRKWEPCHQQSDRQAAQCRSHTSWLAGHRAVNTPQLIPDWNKYIWAIKSIWVWGFCCVWLSLNRAAHEFQPLSVSQMHLWHMRRCTRSGNGHPPRLAITGQMTGAELEMALCPQTTVPVSSFLHKMEMFLLAFLFAGLVVIINASLSLWYLQGCINKWLLVSFF